jgi:acyl-CoA thioester hydrolase
MPAIYHHQLTVPPSAIDGQGHANNLEYLRWMQDAAIAHSAAQGWPLDRYQQLGAGWVVRSHWIEYLAPALAGDVLTVLTWVAEFRKIRSLRKYKLIRHADHAVLAQAETDWAFIGLKHRVPRRIPDELASAFQIVAPQDEP